MIPQKLQKPLLFELHSNHFGVSKMKSLARSYVWWPQIDVEIEGVAKSCESCLPSANNPVPAPLHPLMVPKQPWEQVHIDHTFWGNKVLLVAIDVFSKWPEVHVVSSISAKHTIEKLLSVFAIHGLPMILLSDNGSPFQSDGFKSFVEANGILHRRVTPYHPALNGAAENLVKFVKRSLEKGNSMDSLETKIARFLSTYRNSPYTVTGRTPAEVLLGRAPRTRLCLVHPFLSQKLSAKAEVSTSLRNFEEGQEVLICNHRPDTDSKWRKAKILARLGPLSYQVTVDHQTQTAHVDHPLLVGSLPSHKNDESPEDKQSEDKKPDLSVSLPMAMEAVPSRHQSARSTNPTHTFIQEL